MLLAGSWHIYEMEQWDKDYFNMEVQAYITLDANGTGEFQFGLVSGQIEAVSIDDAGDMLEFTWEGVDELEPVSGSGSIELQDEDIIKGELHSHFGDSSWFLAQRANESS